MPVMIVHQPANTVPPPVHMEAHAQHMARCIELDRYCADICRLAAAFMAHADEHTHVIAKKCCTLCAEICTACAEECEKHDMEHCGSLQQLAGPVPMPAMLCK